MHTLHYDIRAQMHRRIRKIFAKSQMRPVRFVDNQRYPVCMDNSCNFGDIADYAFIRRRGKKDCFNFGVFP